MIARSFRPRRGGRLCSRFAPLLLSLLLACSLAIGCEKVPLLAPTGSTITLTASANVLPVSGTADVIAQVVEAAGTPPHSGTLVTFTTTFGTIQPPEARTDGRGRVVVKFVAGTANGTATIVASSGGATTGTNGAVRIAIGSAAVGRVIVNASPATLPAFGGSTTITASVLDVNGNTLASTPVAFSTTAGALSAAVVPTAANGIASTTLTTNQAATVTASVGAQAPAPTPGTGAGTGGTGTGTETGTGTGTTSSGQASASVTVNLVAAPVLVITPPTAPPSVGLPASFTFAVTPAAQGGTAVREVTVNWGDGQIQNLGAVTGSVVATHVYTRPGTYIVTATVIDAAGNTNAVSTSVTVIPVPRPTIIVTPSPPNPFVNNIVTFTLQVTVAPGIGIESTRIDFGDGTSQDLGGAASASVAHVYTTPGVRTVTVTVVDTTGQTTIGTTIVSVS